MAGKIFFHEDENGVKHDAEHLAEFDSNEEANLNTTLLTIRGYIDDGNSLEEALEMFGTEEMLAAFMEGELTIQDIDVAISEASAAAQG